MLHLKIIFEKIISMSKNITSYASGEHGGYSWRKELDLAAGNFESVIVLPSAIEFSRFYVYARTSGAVGIAGNLEVRQGPAATPSTHDPVAIGTVALTANGQNSAFGDVHGGYLSLVLPAGLPAVGKIEIIAVVKDS